jgi:hypothetical protein
MLFYSTPPLYPILTHIDIHTPSRPSPVYPPFQIQHISPLVFSSITLVDPAITGLIAWLCGIEGVPDIATWAGGFVVVFGVGLIIVGESRRESAEKEKMASAGSTADPVDVYDDEQDEILLYGNEQSTLDHRIRVVGEGKPQRKSDYEEPLATRGHVLLKYIKKIWRGSGKACHTSSPVKRNPIFSLLSTGLGGVKEMGGYTKLPPTGVGEGEGEGNICDDDAQGEEEEEEERFEVELMDQSKA